MTIPMIPRRTSQTYLCLKIGIVIVSSGMSFVDCSHVVRIDKSDNYLRFTERSRETFFTISCDQLYSDLGRNLCWTQ
jgi:hypothetical protein